MESLSFASPLFLVGLALIPVAVLLYIRAERKPHGFAPAALMPAIVPRKPGWRRHAAIAGYGAALTACLVALAKPQATMAVPTEQARVMIVTDHSGSMQATDVKPNRLTAAKTAASTFLDEVPEDVRVGAIAFNQNADVLQSPTRDHEAVKEAVQAIKPAGSTATGDAITAALKDLEGKAPAAIVLLSDGKSVRGSDPVDRRAGRQEAQDPDLHGRARHGPGHHQRQQARPARPRDDEQDRRADRRQELHGERPGRARPGLRAPLLAGREGEAPRRGDEPLRRRRPRAHGLLRTDLPPAPRPAPLIPPKGLPMTLIPQQEVDPAAEVRRALEASLYECKRVVVGQDAMLERLLVALLTGGHVLLEGVPGLAKTLTVRTLATVLGGRFSRIQFTPDLVPADLVGTRIWQPGDGTFRTELGPVFANLLLADEINRAPAKVQSALLEVMQEHQVTIGGQTHRVPAPFLTLATMNPIESEGTYALPEAQVDRFLFKLVVDYPSVEDELTVVERLSGEPPRAQQAVDVNALLDYQRVARDVFCDRSTMAYAVALVDATRHPEQHGLHDIAAADPVRRQPARVAGPRPGVARPRAAARPHARPHQGRPRPRARRAPPPARPLLRRARRPGAPGRPDRPRAGHRRDRHAGAPGGGSVMVSPPGRQGPGPVSDEALARLDLAVARRAAGVLPGERRGPGVGTGTELAQLRPYEPGDDPRQLDAAASARTGVPHIRQHVPERALTTWLVVDLSASMAWGTGERLKSRRRRRGGERGRAAGDAPRRQRRVHQRRRAGPADASAAHRPRRVRDGPAARQRRRGARRRPPS